MTGMSDYTSSNLLNWVSGGKAEPALPSVYMALFNAVGTDSGGGFTEVSGGAYARVQISGSLTTSALTAAANNTLHFTSVPAWVVAGMTIRDATAPGVVTGLTVLSVTSTSVVMSGNATGGGVGSGDSIVFSSFGAATGSSPTSMTNTAPVSFATSTASWGTVVGFGLYDAPTGGNLLLWDFLGNFAWQPFTSTLVGSGNGAVLTVPAHGFAAGTPLVVSAEYNGTLPIVSQGALAAYAQNYAANVTTDTFTLSASSTAPTSANAVWTTNTGDGLIRAVTQQLIPAGISTVFNAGTILVAA